MGQFSDDSVSGLSKISSIKIPQQAGSNTWRMPSAFDAQNGSNDTSLFSCSLPLLPHEKLNFADAESFVQSIDDASSKFSTWHVDMEVKEAMEDHEPNALGNLLPDDEDELLAGIMDDFDLSRLPSQVDDLDEDLFGSGGGLELDFDPPESMSVGFAKPSIHDGYAGTGSGTGHYGLPNGIGTIAGEHPYGEHPSRTLFVRNINSTVEDSEVRALFEQYGEIRTLYTACKHRGFVMISYYDIRAARTAMRALQNKPLRRRKLDIHFSIPKDNPSEKDMNQGTLVAFNLDSSVSNDDLCQIFGAYGEVKEIRETPHKRHHKFIEFYDVRAAEAALRSLNRIDIAGKRIKLEPSRLGGARRNLMQQWPQELEHDENRALRTQVGSPITNSPPGSWAQYSSSSEKSSLQSFSHSPNYGTVSPMSSNYLPGLGSILPPRVSNSVKIAPIGRDQSRISNNDQVFAHTGSANSAAFQHSYLFPERSSGMMPNMSQSPGSMSSCTHSNTSGIGTLTGPQFLWGSPAVYSEHAHSSAWPTSATGQSFTSNGQGQGFPHSSCQSSFVGLSHHHHHVGSAPSGVSFERHFGFFPESPEASFMGPVAFRGIGRNEGNFVLSMGSCASLNNGIALPGNMSENGSSSFRMRSSPRTGPVFLGGGDPFPGPVDGLIECGRSRRVDNNGNQIDSKRQYQLFLDKIVRGEDSRTTLMIKNIPNKYTSKMLLAAIDENHRGTYDFLYLPIDFKNKCNVGYAFINMISPSHIIPFYEAFNGKKWEKFNSEKVASLAYARIQGKAALVAHFQNSSLMNEDKRCRPILFHSEGTEADDTEPFLLNSINVRIHQHDGTSRDDLPESPHNSTSDEQPKNIEVGSSLREG